MAEINDQWNLAFTDNIYISKRSIRKILASKRHYVPVESNTADNENKRGNLNQSSGTEANSKPTVQEMVCLNPRTHATSYLPKISEPSSEEESEVGEADMTTEPGSDPKSQIMSHKHHEDPSIATKVKQEVDITKPCSQRGFLRQKKIVAIEKLEVERDRVDRSNASQTNVLKIQYVYSAMKKRGMEGDTENRPYKCTYCKWAFKKSSNLLSHVKTHRGLKPHVCEMCGKAYSHQGTLQQHKRLHTGERPYKCPFCEKTYIWSSDFRKHIRTHTGEKPYNCEECGKDFVRSSDLRKHERNMHTNNKPFICTECGKTFNKPLSLLRHERTHLGEKPFICPECGKSFALASRMTEHRKVHSDVRPYTCPVCSKAFTKSSNLAEHLTIHTGVRPHKCSECGVAFAMASRLVRHQRTHVSMHPYQAQGGNVPLSHLAAFKKHHEQRAADIIFVCGQCSKSFPQDDLLKEHMQSHSHTDTCDFTTKTCLLSPSSNSQ